MHQDHPPGDSRSAIVNKHRLAIVIPVYNHGNTIKFVVEEARSLDIPIIVVNDGSVDSTLESVSSLDGIKVISHGYNLGKGAAILTGLKEAATIADWAITIDADGQHDPTHALRLVEAIPSGDKPIIVGVREGMEVGLAPWTSRWGRKFSNFWVWMACGLWVSDSQSGFRIYPIRETLNLKSKSRRFQFEVEILALAVWKGIPILEAPVGVHYPPDGTRISHFKPFLDFWRNTLAFSRLIANRILHPRLWFPRSPKE